MRKRSNTLDLESHADREWIVKRDKRERRASSHTIIQWSIFSLHENFKNMCGDLLIHCGMVTVPLINWPHTAVETPTCSYPAGQLNITTVSMVIGTALLQFNLVVREGIVHNSANRCVRTSSLWIQQHTCHVTHKWFQMTCMNHMTPNILGKGLNTRHVEYRLPNPWIYLNCWGHNPLAYE